jgi:CO/xanthine dehydrogenase Mo-binding subunit
MDLPELHAAYVEVPERDGPYGAKAVGEIGALTPTPAILNAIHDAIGVRLFELPASPEKVLRALNSKPVASQHEATEVTVQ